MDEKKAKFWITKLQKLDKNWKNTNKKRGESLFFLFQFGKHGIKLFCKLHQKKPHDSKARVVW